MQVVATGEADRGMTWRGSDSLWHRLALLSGRTKSMEPQIGTGGPRLSSVVLGHRFIN